MKFYKKSRTFIAVLVSTLLLSLIGCGTADSSSKSSSNKEEAVTINVYVPDGLPALSMTKLMKENPNIMDGYNINYNVEKTSDSLVAKVLSSDADIALVPSTLPAQAANKGLDYKVAGTSGWGSLYLIASYDIQDINDIKGKEIYTIGKGLTPDIMFRYLLSTKGIDADTDISINYMNAATELAPAFISGKAQLAVVPEPMLSTILSKKSDTRIVMNLNDEWRSATGSSYGYPQSTLIVKGSLLDEHKDFVDSFLKTYEESVKWENENAETVGQYSEDLGLSLTKELAPKVMERANINYVSIDDCKDEYAKYYEVIMKFAPDSIGGKVPDEGLYIKK